MGIPQKVYRLPLLCALLIALTAGAYWQVTNCGFISYDDPGCVTQNPPVLKGVTGEGLVWAFTTGYLSSWFPLSWISYMVEVEVFGLSAKVMHVTNLLLHLANTVLVLLLLQSITGALWRSVFVAAVFALHPMHVESVAWISERKDVLSTFFCLLSLLAFHGHVVSRASAGAQAGAGSFWFSRKGVYYWVSVLFFACSLMSKAMYVTLPGLLLLLDFWPWQRLGLGKSNSSSNTTKSSHSVSQNSSGARLGLGSLLLEKAPFVVLAAVCSYITALAPKVKGTLASLEMLPADLRALYILKAYGFYLWKTVWPADLSIFYPKLDGLVVIGKPGLPADLSLWEPLLGGACLLGFSVLALRHRRRGYPFTGWFWYVGMLVPVCGILQLGGHAVADRYMYFPMLGLSIGAAWAAAEWLQSHPAWKRGIAVFAVAIVLALAARTSHQVSFWQSSETLFGHAIQVTPKSALAHNIYGAALLESGKTDAAIAQFREVLKLNPYSPEAHYYLSTIFRERGALTEACEHAAKALETRPDYADAHDSLGTALQLMGKADEGLAHLAEAIRLNPGMGSAYIHRLEGFNLKGKFDDTLAQGRELLQHGLNTPPLHLALGVALAGKGEWNAAIGEYTLALSDTNALTKAQRTETHLLLAKSFSKCGRDDAARDHCVQALQLQPDSGEGHFLLGNLLAGERDCSGAVKHWREALNIQPEKIEILNALAWALATSGQAECRDAAEAVRLAEQACTIGQNRFASPVDTLAAAYAAAGEFVKAVQTAEQAIALAEKSGQNEFASRVKGRLELYRQQKAWKEE